jgi:hypothetical protein
MFIETPADRAFLKLRQERHVAGRCCFGVTCRSGRSLSSSGRLDYKHAAPNGALLNRRAGESPGAASQPRPSLCQYRKPS